MAAVRIYLTSGTTFVCPSDWDSAHNWIDAIGAGGAGASLTGGKAPSGGAGGWSRKNNVPLTPGNSYTYNIGAAGVAVSNGDGGDATDTWFGNAVYASANVAAKGGTGGKKTGNVPGVGGQASAGIGDSKFSGGNGFYSAGLTSGYGGGGAAGPNGDGNTATSAVGASADAGLGGAGGASNSVGLPGGNGTEYDATHGSGGGGSGPASLSNVQPGAGGLSGGGGAGGRTSAATKGGEGSPGLIVIEYEPLTSIGTSTVTIANFGATATGVLPVKGDSARTMANFGATATGAVVTHGASARTMANFGATATGVLPVKGDSARTMANFGATASGTVLTPIHGDSARTMAGFTGTATGAVPGHGASAVTWGAFTGAAAGSVYTNIHGASARTMGSFTGMFTGVIPTVFVDLTWPEDLLTLYVEPDWGSAYQVTIEFLTDIVTSRYGREQRRALRQTPRKTLEFDAIKGGNNARSFNRVMRAWQSKRFMVADHTKYVMAALPAFSASLIIDPVPSWLTLGSYLFLKEFESDEVETRVVIGITGTLVSFGNTSGRAWSADTMMMRGQRGRVQPALETTWVTNDAHEMKLTFSVEPGSEPWTDPGTAVQTHRDIEVFAMRPNWRTDLSATYQTNVEMLDINYGTITYYEPQPFRQELWKGNFAAPDPEAIEEVTNFYRRMYGRRGTFYAPTWREDITLASPIETWDFQILAEGREIFDFLDGDPMTRDIAIIDTDFGVHTYRVGDIELLGGNTMLQLTDLLPPGLDVLFISWLSRWRLGSDTLTFAYPNQDVAEFDLSFMSVESDDP